MPEVSLYRNRNFHIVLGASLTMMMMAVSIVPAFPKVVEEFGLAPQSVGLLITVNTLPGLLLAPLAGMMADRLGRKRVLVPTLLLFGMFGGACALSRDFNTLLTMRFLQGIASAPILSVSFAIIGDLFTGRQRAEAMGINGAAQYTGYVIYPLIGGALAGLAWYYPFLVFTLAIPLGFVAIFALRYPEPKNTQTMSGYLGDSLRYLRSWKVAWLFSASALTYVLLFGAYLTYFGILIADRFHAPPITMGLLVSVIGICTASVSSQVGRISTRFSPAALISCSFACYAIALVMIPWIPALWLYLVPAVIFGVGHGLNIPCLSLMASRVTPQKHQAGFMALQTTMILLGMTVAPLIMGLAFTLTDLNTTFVIAAVIALIIPVSAAIIGRTRLADQAWSRGDEGRQNS